MLTHPYLVGFSVKQHTDDLMAEAEHSRLVTAALRRRRAARAAAREMQHHSEQTAASVKSVGLHALSTHDSRPAA